jgi:hypothetical protein
MPQTLRVLLAVLLLAFVTARAQTPAPAPTTSPTAPNADTLWAYAGTWKIEIDRVDTPYSKAGHDTNNLNNDCWKSGPYVACRQIVDGDAKILLVFTCTKPDHTCTSYQIPPNGGDPGSGTLVIEGNTWTFPWSIAEGGKTTYFRVVNIWTSPTTIDYRQEFSTDQVHWTKSASGREVKTGPN